MEFKIIENTLNRVKVSVKIIKRSLAVDPNTHVDTQDVADFLKREGVDFANCIGETVLDNYSDNPKLEGEWVFNKNVQVPTQKKRKTNVAIATGNTTATTKRRRAKAKTEPQKNQFLRTENME